MSNRHPSLQSTKPSCSRGPATLPWLQPRLPGPGRVTRPLQCIAAHQKTESPEPFFISVLGAMIANICTLYLSHINGFHRCLSPFMSILIFFLSVCFLPNVSHYPHWCLQSVINREYTRCFPFSAKTPKAPCSHSSKSLCDSQQFFSLAIFESRNSAGKHNPGFYSESKAPAHHRKFHKF